MRITFSLSEPARRSVRDLGLELADDAPVATLMALVGELLGRPVPPVLWTGGRTLDPAVRVAESGLREGSVLSTDSAVFDQPGGGQDGLRLVAVGGTGAGEAHALPSEGRDLGGIDPGLAGLLLETGPEGVELGVGARGCAARLETVLPAPGARLPWRPGEILEAGDRLWTVRPVPPRATVSAGPQGGIQVSRPPRLLRPPQRRAYRLPAAPPAAVVRPWPVLVAVLPLLAAGAIAWVAHNPLFLMLGLLGPVTVLAGTAVERRSARRATRAAVAEHSGRLAALEQKVHGALRAERDERRHDAPDPAEVLDAVTVPGTRFWERRRTDGDALVLRLGMARVEADVVVESDPEGLRVPRWLAHVPVTVPLAEVGVLGVAAPRPEGRRVLAWLVGQVTALHPPSAVQIVVLCEAGGAPAWNWVRWLPHTRPALGQQAQALVAVGSEAAARRLAELTALVARRTADRATSARPVDEPDVVLVVDGAHRLRALPGLAVVLRDGPACGVRAVCLDTDQRSLPTECAAVAEWSTDGTLRLRRTRCPEIDGIRPDLPPEGWADRLARAMAPLTDGDTQEAAGLPGAARLLDLVGLPEPTPEDVRAGWATTGGRSTRAVLGAGIEGPFAVDLRQDGPHALIAGTTGSGKSELLQTLVASLALANRPDALGFVLIDYKGGAAFRECAELPHTVGLVTDLDGALVERALTSLRAELAARERNLAAAGARDIDEHAELVRRGRVPAPALPRLLIAVDEFAALARELPEFVTGLVDIAQRGRSLGVSLVLATQRPSGCVSPEIRANATLRIGLRMSDAAESSDVLDAPDAARIARATPGRALARLGAGSLLPFQTGRVAGSASRVGGTGAGLTDLPLEALALPAAAAGAAGAGPEDGTDLAVLVAAVQAAARLEGTAPARSPWLPPLPAAIGLADLRARTGGTGAAWALVDRPELQEQPPLVARVDRLHHLIVTGSAGSGRSTVLRSYAAALATAYDSGALHLHVLDCGSGSLLPLADLPHAGAVVGRSEPQRAVRLLNRLVAELRARQVSAAAGDAPAPPATVLLIDGWEGFLATLGELDAGGPLDAVLQLAREGATAGTTLVVAGDRSTLTGKLAGLVEARLLLRLAEPGDYTLAGIPARSLPAGGLAPGRGLAVGLPGLGPGAARTGTAVQVGLLERREGGSPSDALAELARHVGRREATSAPRHGPALERPFRVDALPAQIGLGAALGLRTEVAEVSRRWALVGVGGDELHALGPELAGGSGTFVVAGPARSGRSQLLLTMARSLLAGGVELVVLAPRGGPLTPLADVPDLRMLDGPDPDPDLLADALARPGADRRVLLVDDAERLRDARCRDVLLDAVRAAGCGGVSVVAAGAADELCAGFSGWPVELRRARRGVLLSPQGLLDGDLIGTRLPRTLVGRPVVPGLALLHTGDDVLHTVRVPSP